MIWVALLLCGYGVVVGSLWVIRYMWGARNQPRDLIAHAIAYSALGITVLVFGFFVALILSTDNPPASIWYILSIAVGILSSVMFTFWHFILGNEKGFLRRVIDGS